MAKRAAKMGYRADFRYAQNVARTLCWPAMRYRRVRPDSFYKIETGLLYVSRRF